MVEQTTTNKSSDRGYIFWGNKAQKKQTAIKKGSNHLCRT